MWLVAGLGNPGPKYKATRHNVGFMVVDEFAARAGSGAFKSRFKGEYAEAAISGVGKAHLLKPKTFMNLSGESVLPALKFYRGEASDLIVIHDEVDLPFGAVKIKSGGGLAGHNGLKSIARQLGTRDFVRIRVGVGRPMGRQPLADFVLSAFSAKEREELAWALERAADCVEAVMRDGTIEAMNRLNGT